MGKRLQTYETAAITVTYDPNRCIHAAECVRHLPLVFDTSRRRWIQPDHAGAEEVAAVVRRCPTGALQYLLPAGGALGSEAAIGPAPSEPPQEPPSIQVTRNGPLYLRGDLVVTNANGDVVAQGTRLALCRCGASANKPFCDGSHRTTGFDGTLGE